VEAAVSRAAADGQANTSYERKNAMSESNTVTKDPVCGMTVDTATALHVVRDGKTSYFCSERCRRMFLSQATSTTP
jgi:YHS domain-containing protein